MWHGSNLGRNEAKKRKWENMTEEEKKEFREKSRIQQRKYYSNMKKTDPEGLKKRFALQAQYHREINEIRRERGLCTSCGGERDSFKFVQCNNCRAKQRER